MKHIFEANEETVRFLEEIALKAEITREEGLIYGVTLLNWAIDQVRGGYKIYTIQPEVLENEKYKEMPTRELSMSILNKLYKK